MRSEKDCELPKLRRKLWTIHEDSRIKNELLNLDAASNFRKTVAKQNASMNWE
ncbi:hypothetical protein L917_19557 [Phytophthora nicotianae]|uniref:Uncharacterized protein n=1 Tax=Phytophthora nicotianae TaxID=4792 RepID=W2K412_PHYNI|nr:hypothetical protein L917_19557 [Phytophthora nicotianae]